MKKKELDPLPTDPADPTNPADPDAGSAADGSPEKQIEEPEEEVFYPPVEKVLWYDFDAYDGKDPVLLALMRIELEEDE